jgi:hypothetical protein
MKYMLMFTRDAWQDTASEDELQKMFADMSQWWGRLASQGKVNEGYPLQPPHTATTVVLDHGQSTMIDGPFMEAKETIGGYGIFEVADLDEAIAIARTCPVPIGKVEIRPVVERG